MTDNQPTTRDVSNPPILPGLRTSLRTRTITTVLMVLLVVMIIRDIFARRRAAAAVVRSQRDISLVVR
jgi:hypothetical protein